MRQGFSRSRRATLEVFKRDFSMSLFGSKFRLACFGILFSVLPAFGQQSPLKDVTREEINFFEEKVRPVLHASCLMCHDNEKRTSGLSLETRDATLAGGNRGPAAEPGKPDQSRLVEAVRHTGELKMPPMGKLKPARGSENPSRTTSPVRPLGIPAAQALAGASSQGFSVGPQSH